MAHLKHSLLTAGWIMFLTLPLLAVRVNTITRELEWRWSKWVAVGLCVFMLTWFWRFWREYRINRRFQDRVSKPERDHPLGLLFRKNPHLLRHLLVMAVLAATIFPWLISSGQSFYHVNVLVGALIFVILALGLNITVGLAGLLDLGYVAFFAVGAYTYALLHRHFDLGFWASLPVGGLVGMLFGIILGFPILRVRGDYLAIVTLGFASITKIVLENWDSVFGGAAGIAGIPRPSLFGLILNGRQRAIYSYYIALALVALTIFVVQRLKRSRIGRAWMALREDEIASLAMGVDMARTKLSAYALGAFWAGLAGVLFAAHNTFINPESFAFMESAMILAMVVLGGMGSLPGVIIGALALKLLPEYLRAFAEYRMLAFGALMVLMMIFRPQGLIADKRRRHPVGEPGMEIGDGR